MINTKRRKVFEYNNKYNCIAQVLNDVEAIKLRTLTDLYRSYMSAPVRYIDDLASLKVGFRDKYKFNLADIITEGETSKIETRTLTKFVTSRKTRLRSDTRDARDLVRDKTVYKCFVGKDLVNNVIIHEDIQSSWNCLLASLGRPKHIVIYKIKKDE